MFIKKLRNFLGFVLLLCTFAVQAMPWERTFPDNVKRGKLDANAQIHLVIDGKVREAASGLVVYNEDNFIVMMGTFDAKKALIYYIVNDFGEVQKVWILNAEEAKQAMQKK
jgi:hypothetical protein